MCCYVRLMLAAEQNKVYFKKVDLKSPLSVPGQLTISVILVHFRLCACTCTCNCILALTLPPLPFLPFQDAVTSKNDNSTAHDLHARVPHKLPMCFSGRGKSEASAD